MNKITKLAYTTSICTLFINLDKFDGTFYSSIYSFATFLPLLDYTLLYVYIYIYIYIYLAPVNLEHCMYRGSLMITYI